jgi:electron transfer flavoprotein alpha subunit
MVLVFAEHQKGSFKKAAFEAVTYGHKVSRLMDKECAALVLGNAENAGELGVYGADRVIQVESPSLDRFDSQLYNEAIAQVAQELGADVIVLSHSSTGKSLAGGLAVRLEAGSVSGVNQLPRLENGFRVRKGVFSGKALADFEIRTPVRVLTLMGNSIPPEKLGSAVSVEKKSLELPESRLEIREVNREEGTVPLPEAELVVSAGRGMKGPENWGIIEELADVLGATTACSRPVADVGWRPHHEHVGQTGIAIRPNLYIAAGISGAIQHLAGVNNSKVIVVINKDPEAPFFKAADYGVVGDLFDVVPRLTKAIQEFKEG